MADLRTAIAKELSNLPQPKISKPFDLVIDTPNLWDETKEVEIGWKIETVSEEARIPQPRCDVASELIPLRSDVSTIEVNPSKLMGVQNIEIAFRPIKADVFESRFEPLVKVFRVPFTELTLHKISIFGMNYADKHWHKIAMPKDEKVPETKEKSKE